MHRAVHGLEVVLAALKLHRREHRVRVVRQVPRGLEQLALGDVRGVDERVARLLVPLARVRLHLPADDAALGVEHRQAGADLLGEGEQVELGAELAVVAALGLLQHLQVVVLRGARLPRGAVDPLELRVLLAAAPVRAGVAHQLERRDLPGGRHVRAAAEVLPAQLAGLGVHVVVDGQHARADLGGGLVVGAACSALDADQLELERLVRQLGARVGVGDLAADEPLALLDDVAHPRLDRLQVVGGERAVHLEVVVEAVLHRRADAQLRLGERLLHRLRHDVRGRVPDHRAALGRVGGDRLDLVPVGERPGQVAELPVDAGDDHVPVVGVEVAGGSPRRHLALTPLSLAVEHLDLDLGHGFASR